MTKQEIDELLEGITENTNIRIINIEVLGNIHQNIETSQQNYS
ncbi:hypothetical protein [Staphylococcus phage PMBT8]|nr:hypothetical protein [Staphylococcus phage PMBT8]